MLIVDTTHKTAARYSEMKLVTVLVLDDNKRGKKLQKQKIKQKWNNTSLCMTSFMEHWEMYAISYLTKKANNAGILFAKTTTHSLHCDNTICPTKWADHWEAEKTLIPMFWVCCESVSYCQLNGMFVLQGRVLCGENVLLFLWYLTCLQN